MKTISAIYCMICAKYRITLYKILCKNPPLTNMGTICYTYNMNNYLLIDADSKIPNLALMKISTFLKEKGYQVELFKANISYYPTRSKMVKINAEQYNGVFVSYIFENSKKQLDIINGKNIVEGGVGINLKRKLHPTIERLEPDYSLYSECDISYGFITRGCIRNCYFCKVPKKEGMIQFNKHPREIIKHKKVVFLDNNFLAYKDHCVILVWLINHKIKFQFNGGLDIRLINEENAELLSYTKYIGEYFFAFDSIKSETIINKKLAILKKYITKEWKIKFFIYCNTEMDIKNDVLHRVKWCYDNKVLPYLMRDIDCWNSKNKEFYIDLCAWCNQPGIFKNLSHNHYIVKRQSKNIKRQKKFLEFFN